MCNIAQSTEVWLYFILVAAGGPRYDMNCPEDFMDQVNYKTLLGDVEHEFSRLFGYCEILYVNNTFQFNDYSRYNCNMFPEEFKAKQRDEHFPVDLQNAHDLGKRLAEMAKENV